MTKNKSLLQNHDVLGDMIVNIMLVIFALIIFFPFYNAVVLSFNDGRDAIKGGIYLIPRKFTIDNYKQVFSDFIFLTAAVNTVTRTITGTLTSLFLTAAFAYAVSKNNLVYGKLYMILAVITIYFNGGLIPTFLVVTKLGLYDNFLVYILPNMINAIYILMFFAFFKGIPVSLEESARLDGANDLKIFLKIIVPTSTPVFAAIGLFIAVANWNSWYDTMLYTRKDSLETLSHLFMKMVLSQRYIETAAAKEIGSVENLELKGITSMTVQLAAMVVTTAPIMLVYPYLQKYFVKGIMIGSVKG